MGLISRKLDQRLMAFKSQKVIPFQEIAEAKKLLSKTDHPRLEDLNHLDPAHALYIHIFNTLITLFEQMSELPEMEKFYDIIEEADDEYMPIGPPMSPLTRSFFNGWAFLDLQVGKDRETFASIVLGSTLIKHMDREFARVMRLLASSRMGMYEYLGEEGRYVHLRELVTGKEILAFTPLSYRSHPGSLWFARVLPPPLDPAHYWLVFTTPYVFAAREKERWESFLRRTIPKVKTKASEIALDKLFKCGLNRHYWNEFVLESYVNYEAEACFLTGVPDEALSRPHSKESQARH